MYMTTVILYNLFWFVQIKPTIKNNSLLLEDIELTWLDFL